LLRFSRLPCLWPGRMIATGHPGEVNWEMPAC
jgi:hypothetical protein